MPGPSRRRGCPSTPESTTGRVAYATLGDLVFLLMVTPWSIREFDPEREIDTLLAVEDAYGSGEGIVLTEHRYLIVAEHDG